MYLVWSCLDDHRNTLSMLYDHWDGCQVLINGKARNGEELWHVRNCRMRTRPFRTPRRLDLALGIVYNEATAGLDQLLYGIPDCRPASLPGCMRSIAASCRRTRTQSGDITIPRSSMGGAACPDPNMGYVNHDQKVQCEVACSASSIYLSCRVTEAQCPPTKASTDQDRWLSPYPTLRSRRPAPPSREGALSGRQILKRPFVEWPTRFLMRY